jgi:hypothetical protein
MLFVVFLTGLLGSTSATEGGDCSPSESCIPIRSCDPIVEQLQIAKSTFDSEKKREIIGYVRSKICGDIQEKLICCPQEQLQGGQLLEQQQEPQLEELGEMINIYHDIRGTVYAVGDNKILIKGFNYDGEGPDAFFLAGEQGEKPNSRFTKDDLVLPYPFSGSHYSYTDSDIPILQQFNGDRDVLLTLPPGRSVRNLRWLAVWCRDYKVNFGYVTFP